MRKSKRKAFSRAFDVLKNEGKVGFWDGFVWAGGDENGSGMAAFVRNSQALSARYGCFVLAIHHCGLGDDRRCISPARERVA